MLKRLMFVLALALCPLGALAQVNVVPQVGVNTANLRYPTYGAISIGLVPAAAATDIACLQGSASKVVTLNRLLISGTAGTAITTPFVILKRVLLDSGGTPATSTALPVAGKYDPQFGTATATLNAWTANPTINDASPTYIAAPAVTLPVTASSGTTPTEVNFGTWSDAYNAGIVLRGATQAVCINLNAATVTSGVLAITFEWVEQ